MLHGKMFISVPAAEDGEGKLLSMDAPGTVSRSASPVYTAHGRAGYDSVTFTSR